MTPELNYLPGWLDQAQASALMAELLASAPLVAERGQMFGRPYSTPRLTAWHADPGCVYRYSGVTHPPSPWLPALSALRERLERELAAPFNCVLLNLYRDGADKVGWHADDEACFGPAPVIASLSLGAVRRFLLKPKDKAHATLRHELLLEPGSLLVMGPTLQPSWLHSIPATRKPTGARLNLTWRHFLAPISPA